MIENKGATHFNTAVSCNKKKKLESDLSESEGSISRYLFLKGYESFENILGLIGDVHGSQLGYTMTELL